VLVPARTPTALRDIVHTHVVKAMRSPELAQRFAYEGGEIIASSPAYFAAHIESEIARWAKVLNQGETVRAN